MLVYVCYLDDSTAELSPVQTLAGYVARLDGWRAFEADADAICKSMGVDILHAKEFQDTKGCFKGWSGARKLQFIDMLYTAAAGRVDFGISRSILKEEYRKRQRELGLNKSTSAYGVAFASIVFTAVCDNTLSPFIVRDGMSFIVEAGHNNNEEIHNHYHRIKDHQVFADGLRSLTFARKEDSRAIQLADFYAFYSRRLTTRYEKHKEPQVPEPHFRRFIKRVPHFQNTIYDAYGGPVLDDYSEFIPKRAPDDADPWAAAGA